MEPVANIYPSVGHLIDPADRWSRQGHQGGVLWLTGLSGSGKSTLATTLEARIFGYGYQTYALDGDNLRHGLNADLGFSPNDRSENIRRVGEVAALLASAGVIVVTAFISPYREDRRTARTAVGEGFREVFLNPGLEVCERRDPKGLYKKARAGQIPEFTGISAPYEEPEKPDVMLDTGVLTCDECVEILADFVDRTFRQI